MNFDVKKYKEQSRENLETFLNCINLVKIDYEDVQYLTKAFYEYYERQTELIRKAINEDRTTTDQ